MSVNYQFNGLEENVVLLQTTLTELARNEDSYVQNFTYSFYPSYVKVETYDKNDELTTQRYTPETAEDLRDYLDSELLRLNQDAIKDEDPVDTLLSILGNIDMDDDNAIGELVSILSDNGHHCETCDSVNECTVKHIMRPDLFDGATHEPYDPDFN